jgi:ring-1,2-phenylacetyl-CoA epoxidase subunit PaaE
MPQTSITIRHNGITYNLTADFNGESILDAALMEGINLPYSCKNGICGTCRAKLLEGKAQMDFYFALGPGQVQQGWILTCRSHPVSEKLVVDFDAA